jgi:hypothetical protein
MFGTIFSLKPNALEKREKTMKAAAKKIMPVAMATHKTNHNVSLNVSEIIFISQ